MANCVQCGRALRSFSFGEASDTCADCRNRQQPETPTERGAPGKPTTSEVVKAFPVTSAIVAINVAVYLVCVAASYAMGQPSVIDFSSQLLAQLGANFGPFTLGGQWWRLFTCMWMHGGLIHIGANMYCFWSFGRIAERIFGRKRYLATYIITGLVSSLVSVAWHPFIVSIGASGAIFGVAGALFVPFYRKRLNLPPPVMNSMLRNIGMFIVINLLIGASLPFIDNSAHVGGLVAGLILGNVFVQMAAAREDSVAKVVMVSAILVVLAFVVIRHERWPGIESRLKQLQQRQGASGPQ
jgi:rhomboid protease GluP